MLDLLLVECFLFVVFGLGRLLHPRDFFLLLQGLIHAIGHFLLLAHHIFAKLVDLAVSIKLNPLSFLQGLSETLTSHLFPGG